MTSGILLEITLKSTAVLLASVVITRFLKRSSASIRHLVWAVTFLGIAVLPFIVIGGPAWSIPILPQEGSAEMAAFPSDPRPSLPVNFSKPEIIEHQNGISPNLMPMPFLNIPALVVALWLLGVVVMVLRIIIGLTAANRIATTAEPISNRSWIAMTQRISNGLGLKRPVSVLKTARITVPAATGIMRSRILLPVDAETWNEQRQCFD